MRKLISAITIVYFTCSLIACGSKQQGQNTASGADSSKDAYIVTVKAMEDKMKTMTTLDNYNVNLGITAYMRFATKFPDDTLAPVFIFKAANLATTGHQYERALTFYNTICTKYPNFRRVPDCIFVQGYIYDNMKDTAKAHAKYAEVIAKFPNNSLAPQAQAAIAALGKTDEQLMKEFEAKNKKIKS